MQLYIALGLIALMILSALAITSNKWSMRRLGKNWKRLHRLVYCVGIIVVVHGLLASTMSKRMMVRDPQAETELSIYLAALAILLIVRIPFVRASLLKLRASYKGEQQIRTPRVVPAIPTPLPQPPILPMPDEIIEKTHEPEREIVH
jgi:sulfoxide reductase heme-binding subunit YedZ